MNDSRSRRQATRAILQIGDPEEMLALLLKENAKHDDRVRAGSIAAVGSIGARAEPLVPDLIKLLQDPSEIVRISAVRSLAQIGPVAAPAVPELLTLESTATNDMRATILLALGWIGVRSPEVTTRVLAALQEGDSNLAAAAADVLAMLGPTKDAIPGLIRLLEGGRGPAGAAKALGLLGPAAEDAVPALIASLPNGTSTLGKNAIIALGEIGPLAIASVPRLEELLKIARGIPAPQWQDHRKLIEKSLSQIRGN